MDTLDMILAVGLGMFFVGMTLGALLAGGARGG